jgi:hypothetical protein
MKYNRPALLIVAVAALSRKIEFRFEMIPADEWN